MIKLAIFDCDGTLVDSGATIRSALEQAFEARGLTCPPVEVTRKVIGLSLMESMAVLVPDGDHAALGRAADLDQPTAGDAFDLDTVELGLGLGHLLLDGLGGLLGGLDHLFHRLHRLLQFRLPR